MKKTMIFLLAAVLAGFLAACGGPKETTLDGEEKEAVLAYSEIITDNLMAAMNAGDYAAFSKDFSQDMLNAMSQTEFENFKEERDAKLGAYVSRQVSQVNQSQSGDFVAVVYDTAFEKEKAVTMRVVFRKDEPHEVSGLWFNQ